MHLDDITPDRVTALLRFSRTVTGDRGLAEDIVQDVLVKLLQVPEETLRDPDAYARRMIVNEFLSWKRKWSRISPVDVIHIAGTVPDHSDRLADMTEMQHLLNQLSRKQRAAIVLRYYADLPDADIAETLGMSHAATRSLIQRAMATLRMNNISAVTSEVKR